MRDIVFCRRLSVTSPLHRPFFFNPSFFPSPPKSFVLPSYAEEMANQYARNRESSLPCRSTFVSNRVLQFVDTEAVESEGEEFRVDISDGFSSPSSSSTGSGSEGFYHLGPWNWSSTLSSFWYSTIILLIHWISISKGCDVKLFCMNHLDHCTSLVIL